MKDKTYRAGELEHYFAEESEAPFGISTVVKHKLHPDTTLGFISGVEEDPYSEELEKAYKSLNEITKRIQKNAGVEPSDTPYTSPGKISGEFVYRVEWSAPPPEIGDFTKFVMPIVRRVYAGPIANEITKVQPMSLPSGMSFYLDHTYGKGQNPCGEIPLPETIKEEYTIGADSCKAASQSTSGTALEKSGWASSIRTAFTRASTGVAQFVKQIAKLAVELINFLK